MCQGWLMCEGLGRMMVMDRGPTLDRVASEADENETVGQQVRRRREALPMSGRELSAASGVHRNTIAKIEKDDPSVEEFTVARLLAALDRLEHRYATDDPDMVVQVMEIELPDGRRVRVTHTGTAANVAEAAMQFLRERKPGEYP